MTEKRFALVTDDNIEFLMQDKLLLPIYDGKKRLNLKEVYNLLNELNDKNEQLKKEKDALIQGIQDNAKIAADGMVKSMEQNFTIDTKYYRRRY